MYNMNEGGVFMKYHHIFNAVSDKISEVLHIQDEETKEVYINIIKQLSPGNDYTFVEIMKEYIAEYQQKSFQFYQYKANNGFVVNRSQYGLEVVEVNKDTRFVVGDMITHLSNDAVEVLSERYRKLLFHDAIERQEWSNLILKQVDATVKRSSESYEFELKRFEIADPIVHKTESYQHVLIYAPEQLHEIKSEISTELPIILDVRYTEGTASVFDIKPEVILMSRPTKGSIEQYIVEADALKVGEASFGALSKYESIQLGQYTFEYGVTGERTAYPDVEIINHASDDQIMEFAKRHVMNHL